MKTLPRWLWISSSETIGGALPPSKDRRISNVSRILKESPSSIIITLTPRLGLSIIKVIFLSGVLLFPSGFFLPHLLRSKNAKTGIKYSISLIYLLVKPSSANLIFLIQHKIYFLRINLFKPNSKSEFQNIFSRFIYLFNKPILNGFFNLTQARTIWFVFNRSMHRAAST